MKYACQKKIIKEPYKKYLNKPYDLFKTKKTNDRAFQKPSYS